MLTTLDFPVKPHVLKYLAEHLRLGAVPYEAYTLSPADRFGKMLFHLLRRQLAGRLSQARANEQTCTQRLQVDLRNFPVHQYGLTELTPYTIYQFNDFVDELLKEELYLWVRKFVNRQTQVQQVIEDFMAGYDLREEDIKYETLKKAVQRNVNVKQLHKKRPKSVGKMSRESSKMSRETGKTSPEDGNLSRYAFIQSMRQQLTADAFPR